MATDPLKILADIDQPEPRRIEAAKALGKAKAREHIDRLYAIADRAETLLIKAIMDALKAMDAHEALGPRLADRDPAVRADAAKKLSKLQDPRAAQSLLAASVEKEPTVRRAAIHGLSYLTGAKVYDALNKALRDDDPETRAYAAAGIGRSGDPRAARVLAAAREAEQDDVVKDFIDAAIRKLPEQPAAK